ncbi:MAG TPA: glycosyltransferase family 4 protein, partial [Candidatus Limnocylindria bacterium]|nr:glycosyltransferase family 4 protein [Candidatus Limnocylindria bacterium]
MKIAIFHLGFFYSGGGEKLVLEQARQLAARGHDVRVFAPIVDTRACFPDLIAQVNPRRLLPRIPNLFGVGDGLTLLAASIFAKALVRNIDADVYLGANQPGAWLAR